MDGVGDGDVDSALRALGGTAAQAEKAAKAAGAVRQQDEEAAFTELIPMFRQRAISEGDRRFSTRDLLGKTADVEEEGDNDEDGEARDRRSTTAVERQVARMAQSGEWKEMSAGQLSSRAEDFMAQDEYIRALACFQLAARSGDQGEAWKLHTNLRRRGSDIVLGHGENLKI